MRNKGKKRRKTGQEPEGFYHLMASCHGKCARVMVKEWPGRKRTNQVLASSLKPRRGKCQFRES